MTRIVASTARRGGEALSTPFIRSASRSVSFTWPRRGAPPAVEQPLANLPAPVTETLTVDATRTTATGATFTAPAGWMLRSEGETRLLDATLLPVDPGVGVRAELVVGDQGSVRRLILRDAQHEHVFTEGGSRR